MSGEPAPSGLVIRTLRSSDLDDVVAIDRGVMGRARSAYYGKRLAHLEREPAAFVALAAERQGRLVGFALARLYEGEFGGAAPEGALEAIGIAADERHRGVARALTTQLAATMRERGVRAIASEADWTATELLGFFASNGFAVAPEIVLERRLDMT